MDVEEWINSKPAMSTPVDESYELKQGVISDFRLVDTKFGTKLLIEIDFGTPGNPDKRAVFLSKTLAAQFRKLAGKSETWKGKKVQMIPMNMAVQGILRKKLFPQPTEVQ